MVLAMQGRLQVPAQRGEFAEPALPWARAVPVAAGESSAGEQSMQPAREPFRGERLLSLWPEATGPGRE
ncbi:MAG: hypothetical protein CME19_12695 [Gemmatimonadetes bacterium]|nr:hypothetical protein [Gemmatimonadota bacterium]